MIWAWLKDWWHNDQGGGHAVARRRRMVAPSAPAMVEYLETREMLAGAAVDTTTSANDLGVIQLNAATGEWQASRYDGTQFVAETVTNWNAVPADTVVIHGDLWGNDYDGMVRFDRATGDFIAEWKQGAGIATGVITSWLPNMDLQFLTMQDLNHDGRDDIIGQDRTTGRWAVAMSAGAGSYNSRFIGTWQVGVNWEHVNFADLNGDQLDDVIAIDPVTNNWNLLLGTNGDFTSLTVGNAFAANRIGQLVVGNYDGNPGLDVLQRESSSGLWLKSSVLGNGFYSQVVGLWSPSTTWSDVVTLDFWGTGRDAVLGRDATNNWQILWSAGSGNTTASLGSWAVGTYADAQVGDFNGDGREDLLAQQVATGRWFTLASSPTSSGTSLFGAWAAGTSYDVVQAGDFNSDGKADLIARETTTGAWRGILSTANGTVATTLAAPEFDYIPTDVMFGDFDADGKADILSRDHRTGNRLVIEVNGSQLAAARFNTWTAYGTGWIDQQIIDFNGDGDTDLLARDASTGDWWLTTLVGTTPTTSKIANWSNTETWQSLVTVDFDGNETVDVLGRNASTGNWHLLRMVDGVASSTVIANWSTATTWTDFQVADLMGNGRPMLIARDAASNLWRGVWSVGNAFSTGDLRGLAAGRSYADTRVVDFFGDGRQTVVTRDASTGVWYGLWYGANQFRLTNLGGWNPAGNWDSVLMADLEGDGKQALYGHDAVSGQWRRIGFDGVTATNAVVAQMPANTPVELASAGNFLLATRDAILARNKTTGEWIRLSNDGTGYQLASLGLWAESATWTSTAVADYNRDSRADVFGYSTHLGTWRIRSFDGTNWFGVAGGDQTAAARIVDVPGASSATLRATILSDLPGLQSALVAGDTRTAVRLLRMWTANAGDLALFSNPLLGGASDAASAYYSAYAPNRAGSSCGGIGEFYTQVLKLFSIDSLTVSFGDYTADLIHTTVIVPIREGNAWSFEVYDPTFNGTPINSTSGNPASYLDIVSAVQAGNTSGYGLEQAANDNREFLSAVELNMPMLTLDSIQNGVYVYRWQDYGLDDYLATYEPTLIDHGYTPGLPGFFELMPKVISVYANNGSGNPQVSADMKAAFLAGLSARGITVAP